MWFTAPYPECSAKDVGGKAFDYIIIGGGTAGCVVASRLSEDENISVLVLERGRVMDTWMSRTPLASQDYRNKSSQAVWRPSLPMKACNNRIGDIWVAEALGGSSRINGMLYTRSSAADYNHWKNMGHPTWGYHDVEPYFIKSESSMSHQGVKHRGHGGPLVNRQANHPFRIYDYCAKAAEAVGLRIEDDANSPYAPAIGYFHADHAIDDKNQRVSAYHAFLSKNIAIKRKSELCVCTGANAIKLEFDMEASRVTGVHFISVQPSGSATVHFVTATREIIVCSGAIGSPQLLMLSGIGPREHLEEIGIQLIRDMAGVGSNLADHHAVPIMAEIPMKETYHQLTESVWLAIWAFLQMLIFRTGLLSTTSPPANIFLRSDALDDTMKIKPLSDNELDSTNPKNIPDVEVMFIANRGTPVEPSIKSAFTFFTTLVQPHSRGTVRLRSTNSQDQPLIDLNMLSDERDLVTARKAVRFTLNFASYIKRVGYPHKFRLFSSPAGRTSRELRDLSDEEIDAWVRQNLRSALHYSSTCRMASLDDPECPGVVDDELRVHGFDNLRIADASVFPKIVSAHTMAPVVMVAERCADFVKRAWIDAY
ncbi:hypothetical protein S7711_09821 [Stachybotrys chartarum IBT 7711]|uniref:Glucose-methanol-choline oxidoreductase N-terminal domain-containing protein n=1 Tax=Stachybotrys chartarum (strain CBS 109288 / IBT 7711) TaxID=1280523 RepID=A0A084B7N2_STACB|nr:hypothetical protein S7711_09821 [Stachybotrys chartarum IBT 7711]